MKDRSVEELKAEIAKLQREVALKEIDPEVKKHKRFEEALEIAKSIVEPSCLELNFNIVVKAKTILNFDICPYELDYSTDNEITFKINDMYREKECIEDVINMIDCHITESLDKEEIAMFEAKNKDYKKLKDISSEISAGIKSKLRQIDIFNSIILSTERVY